MLLLIVVWALPTAFTACDRDSWWCSIAYYATESAGKTGTFIVLFLTCFFYTIHVSTFKKKFVTFIRAFLIIGIILGGVAYVNEHVTKEALAIARPSHLFIAQHQKPFYPIDSLYKYSDDGRKNILQKLIHQDSTTYLNFDKRVIDHWVEESGYSFPSGHSFNAFLLATLIGYSMLHSRSALARSLFLIPLIWALLVAVSRVAIGAHSALDVSVGAALGTLLAHLLLYTDITRSIITKRE